MKSIVVLAFAAMPLFGQQSTSCTVTQLQSLINTGYAKAAPLLVEAIWLTPDDSRRRADVADVLKFATELAHNVAEACQLFSDGTKTVLPELSLSSPVAIVDAAQLAWGAWASIVGFAYVADANPEGEILPTRPGKAATMAYAIESQLTLQRALLSAALR
jgi:hypothetical protein